MDDHELTTFTRTFAALVDHVLEHPPGEPNPVVDRLTTHLGTDPMALPIVSAAFAPFEHPDLQLAIDAYVRDRSVTSFGMSGSGRRHMDLSELLGARYFNVGPVVRIDLPVDVDETMACIEFAFLLVSGPDDPPHVLVVRVDAEGIGPTVMFEVMSAEPGHASAVVESIRAHMRTTSVYRGKVFALSRPDDEYEHRIGVAFMPRPSVARDDIVLPDGVLERIERRTVDFDAVADTLAVRGLARKRGILLYGPPGTGKTLTIRHLIGRLRRRTTVVLTGIGLGAIGTAANLARRLQPSLLVLEDVDLIAQERDYGYENPLLFELLNELDGIGEDSDVLTLLTTNRADLLEPALASRPGRVDLAVELPLPGTDEQRRLLELYSRTVATDVADWDTVIERVLGTPASFVRELIRTAALHATFAGSDVVTDAHLDRSITELLDSGPVTPRLHGIGVDHERDHDDDFDVDDLEDDDM
jgi:cell division protease FtsH